MKKRWVILCVVLVLLLAVVIVLTVRFFGLFGAAQTDEETQLSVEDYAQQKFAEYSPRYDAESATLTLSKPTTLGYDDAVKLGGSIYEGDLAPETYLAQVQSILLNVKSSCNAAELTVVLCYQSTDGETIFSVASDGTIQTCWETK